MHEERPGACDTGPRRLHASRKGQNMKTRRRLLRANKHRIVALPAAVALATLLVQVSPTTQALAADTSQAYFGGLTVVPSQDGLPPEIVTAMSNILDSDSTLENVPPGGTSQRGRYSQPFSFGGRLLDPSGSPIAGAQLQASLVPGSKLMSDNKDDAEVLPIQAVVTDSNGFWTFHIPALKQKYVGDYVQDDGGIDVSFTSFGSGYALLAELSMMPPTSSESVAYAMAEDDDMLDPNQIAFAQNAIDQGASLPGTGIVVSNLTLRAVAGQSTDPNVELPASDLPEPDYSPYSVCSAEYPDTVPLVSWKYTWGTTDNPTWVPIQRLQTRSYTTEYYQWKTSNSMETQYGIDLSYEGVTAKGSYVHSVVNSYGDSKTYGHNLVQQEELGWNYRYYYLKCYDKGIYHDAGVKELRPYKYNGSIRDVNYYGFTCNYKSTISAGHVPETDNVGSYTRVGGVAVRGFGLNSTMANGTQTAKKWNISSTHSAILCGENDYWPYTARSMEGS
jgi:hypothetical protein